jgi:hypothetical protein
LPEIIASYQAGGWLADGLSRLYVVEGVDAKYGGHVVRLDVGPATATGVRIDAEFRVGHEPPVRIRGVVPLAR